MGQTLNSKYHLRHFQYNKFSSSYFWKHCPRILWGFTNQTSHREKLSVVKMSTRTFPGLFLQSFSCVQLRLRLTYLPSCGLASSECTWKCDLPEDLRWDNGRSPVALRAVDLNVDPTWSLLLLLLILFVKKYTLIYLPTPPNLFIATWQPKRQNGPSDYYKSDLFFFHKCTCFMSS